MNGMYSQARARKHGSGELRGVCQSFSFPRSEDSLVQDTRPAFEGTLFQVALVEFGRGYMLSPLYYYFQYYLCTIYYIIIYSYVIIFFKCVESGVVI